MRYVILVLLNMPIIILAALNFVTKYKLKKITKERFVRQMFFWIALCIVLIASFPAYNLLTNRPIFDSSELSLFDIVQTTAIIFLIFTVNNLRQKLESTTIRLRDFHQEISIQLSTKQGKK